MKRGQKRRRELGDQGKGTQPGPWVGVFGTEAAPLTQDADRLLVSLLPSGGGRASQRPAAPPQLPPDEPVEDAEAQEGQEEVGGGDPQHDAQRAPLRRSRPALPAEQRRARRRLGPRRRGQRWRPRGPEEWRWRRGAGRGGELRGAVKVLDRVAAGVLLDAHQKEEGPGGEQRHGPERGNDRADAAAGDEDAGPERATDGEVAVEAERRHVQQRGVGAALAHVEREAAEQRTEHPGPGAPEAVQVEGEPEQDKQVRHGHAAQVQAGGGPHVPVAPDQRTVITLPLTTTANRPRHTAVSGTSAPRGKGEQRRSSQGSSSAHGGSPAPSKPSLRFAALPMGALRPRAGPGA